MILRRSFLYMPGSDWRKIEKAATELNADSICMDLEDGVALSRKEEARETIVRALNTLDFGHSERLVRVNAAESGLIVEDLTAIIPARPNGIVVPKVKSGGQFQWISERIAAIEGDQGWEIGEISLLAIIESALGVVNLPEIVKSSPRLSALIFGAEDLASDVGATRTPESWEVFYARSAVVTYAAAFNLGAIDMVYLDFHNPEGLLAETRHGIQMGFSGKQLIHPGQIDPVHEAYTPTDAEIKEAKRILKTHQSNQDAGTGAFALEGKMVDMPVVIAAEKVLERARASGKF